MDTDIDIDRTQADGDHAPRRDPAHLEAGCQVDRYLVLAEVGAGSMGVVYAAYDPELDRKLALKLLLPRFGGEQGASAGRTRLLREAQVLARLRHPNVVSVHDVGTYEGRVYIAMEFVDGETMGAWLSNIKPSRAEILRVFMAAGRGLATAHRAELIHRDFKPDNVIVARDGSVRVLDFGLARATGDASGGAAPLSEPLAKLSPTSSLNLGNSSALSTELTRTGGIMGTPAYMAPEQHLGLEVTAASDQFAFAVALYEALYGERPFGGDTLPALAFAVTQGKIREPRVPSRSVPRWLRQVLLRALRPDPEERYPDMEALLRALTSNPHQKWAKRAAWVAGAGLVAGLAWPSPPPVEAAAADPCAGVEAPIDAVWSPERARALSTHFEASGLAFAELSAAKLGSALDGWSEAWRSQRRETCEATRVHASQSESLFDRRMLCLDRALGRTAALVERLESADDTGIERASEALEGLPDLDTCANRERLMSVTPILAGEAKLEADAIAEVLDAVEAMMVTGEYKKALTLLTELQPRIEALGDPLTERRAAVALADLHKFAEDEKLSLAAFTRAYLAADRAGDDWSRVRLAIELMEVYGHGRADAEAAAQWEAMAEAVIGRIGNPTKIQVHFALARGTVLTGQGKFEDAIAQFERALAQAKDPEITLSTATTVVMRQRLAVAFNGLGRVDEAEALQNEMLDLLMDEVGPRHPRTAVLIGSLGNSDFNRGRYAEAARRFEEAAAIIAESYGEDNPRYYDRLNNYAAALTAMGNYREAERIHLRILAYNTERFGDGDLRLTHSLENLGNALTAQGHHEEAKRYYLRSLAIKTEHHGPDHPTVATSKMNLGVALFSMGDYAGAEALYLETLETLRERVGSDHADVGLTCTNIGDVHEAQGRYRSAARYQAEALRIFEAAWGEENIDLAWPLTGLGIARLGLGDHTGALEVLTRARALRAGKEDSLPEGERARTDFAYARALPAERRAEAEEVARAALPDARAGDPELAAKIDAWL
ncbi:MAG: serine/threonine-protein kinase [Myxococcota bacterium]